MSLVLVFVLGLSSFFSPLRALSLFNQFWALVLLIWLIVTILDNPVFIFKSSKFNLLIYVFVFYTISIPYILDNYRIGNRYFELSQLFVFYLAYKKNIYIHRPQDNLKIIKWIVPFIVIISISTLYAYRTNPIVSRGISSGDEVSKDALLQGVGGYEFIYMLVILYTILLTLFWQSSIKVSIRSKVLLLILLLIFGSNIVLSNYSTAFLLLLVNTVFIIIIRRINWLWFWTFVVVSLIIIGILPQMLSMLRDFLGEGLNANRINELLNYLEYNSLGNAMDARLFAYRKSLEVFCNNPLLGIISQDLNYYDNGVTGFGQHSTILDTLALFGIFIGIFQVFILTWPFLVKMSSQIHLSRKLTLITMTTLVLLLLVNNLTPSIGFMAFFMSFSVNDWIKSNC